MQGGDLTVGTSGELVSFDPAKISGFGTLVHPLLAVYDTLLRLNADGTVRPNMAASMKPSTDFTMWTMQLNAGIRFSDGSVLDAAAVKANIDRHLDKSVKSQSASLLAGVTEMTIEDPTTITFHLSSPDVAFDSLFTLQPGLIAAPSTLVAGYDLDSKPIGAGPFVLQSWQRDSEMKLSRNTDYWQSGLPYLDTLTFRPVPDTLTRVSSLKSGDIQLSSFIDQTSIDSATDDKDLVVDAEYGNGGDVLFLNSRSGPLSDLRVRTALAQGLDLDAMNQVLFGGKMNVANGPFTTDSPYYVADNGYPTFDVSAAKAAIDAYQSETGQKVSLELAVNNVPDRIQLAQLLQSMWQAIDVEITITPLDPAEVSARFSSANFQIAVRNIPTFTEPEPLLSRWFYGSSPLNFSGLVSPQLDAAFDSGRTSSDSADRVSAYQEVSRQLATTLPVLWYAHGVRGYAHSVKLTLGPDNLQNVLWYEEIGFTS